jgi:hypothetical protein
MNFDNYDIAITEAACKHIESEIFLYFETLKNIDSLEHRFSTGWENVPDTLPTVSRVALQRRYYHLKEVINSIDIALAEQSEQGREAIQQIYWTHCSQELDKEAQETKNKFIKKIAMVLGWR